MLIDAKQISENLDHGVPKGIIHVGAHAAEELDLYHQIGVSRIIWIEANPMMLQRILSKTIFEDGSSVYCFAALDRDGTSIDLNIANNGESSSIFELKDHLTEHPHIHYVGKINVPACKIDTFMERKGFDIDEFDFVNIDIQGAELLALKGMKKQLKNINYAYLEVNEKHLYENCCLIQEIDEFLNDFDLHRKVTKMTQHGWGDALYVRGK